LNDFSNIAVLHQDVEASEKERTNVLNKRNLRRESLHRQAISDDDVEASSSSKRDGNKNKELFNGLISDPSQIKKKRNNKGKEKKNR